MGIADPQHVARLKLIIRLNTLVADDCPVTTLQIAQGPMAGGMENLRMVAATTFVFDDNLVGGSTADGHRLTGNEPEDVGPFGTFPNDQIGNHEF